MAEKGNSQQRAHPPPPPPPPPLTTAPRSIRAVDSLHGLPPFGVSYAPGSAQYIGRTTCAPVCISNAALPLSLVHHLAGTGDVGARISSSPNSKHRDVASHITKENIKKSESHVCNICSKSYSSSRGLGRHTAVHNKSAPGKGSKRSHAKTAENDGCNSSSPSTGKLYFCNICGKSYSSRHAIGGHVAGHKKGLQATPGKRGKSKSGSTSTATDGPNGFVVPSSLCPDEILSGAAGDVAGSSGRSVSTSNDQLNERLKSLSPGNDDSCCEEPVSKKGKESEH